MAKYDGQFKLSVVQRYLSGQHGGLRAVAAFYGLSHSQVRGWTQRYQQHGLSGLNKKRSVYDAAFKMKVLKHLWRDELSCQQVAQLYDIRCSAHVAQWQRQYDEGGVSALEPKPRGRPKTMATPEQRPPVPPQSEDTRTLEQLRKENEYLRAEVAYLKKLRALRQEKEQAAQKKRG